MSADDTDGDDALLLETVGARLNRARLAKGRSLADIAATTRIPAHYLAAIEEQRFADLPARTYVFGFTRSFAREVGLDPEAMLNDLHAEFDHRPEARAPALAPVVGDRAEAPSARVAWIAAFAALVVAIAALLVWRSDDLFDGGRIGLLFAPSTPTPSPSAPPAPPPTDIMPTTAASAPEALASDSASESPAPLATPSDAASDASPSPAPRHPPRPSHRASPQDDMGPGPVINPPSATHGGGEAPSAVPPVNVPPVNTPPASSAPSPSPATKPSTVSQ